MDGEYVLHLDDELATELPEAPPITKDNLPPVCRSEVLEFIGETITRVTWTLFLSGVKVLFTAEHNRRMQTGSLLVSGKIVFQWNCEDPAESSDLPYLMTKESQKFTLSWLVTDTKESFDLQVNNKPMDRLVFLDSSFKLTDDNVEVYHANTIINGQAVTDENRRFEHSPCVLTHMVLDKIGEDQITEIRLERPNLATSQMNETLATYTSLNIPETGLSKLELNRFLENLTELLSSTVLE